MDTRLASLVLLTFTVFQHREVICDQCPGKIGTNNETSFSAVRDRQFYLNTADPAPCNGTVTSWRYCYYKPGLNWILDGYRFNSFLAVYRLTTSLNGSISYTNVSSRLWISLTGRQIKNATRSSNFVCNTVDDSNIDVEAGDVFGVCIYNPSRWGRYQLDLVGQANGYSLVQKATSDCWRNVTSFQQTAVDSRILHVYANITRRYTSPPRTTMSPIEQTTMTTWTTTDSTTLFANEVTTKGERTVTNTATSTATTDGERTATNTTTSTATTDGERTGTNTATSTATTNGVRAGTNTTTSTATTNGERAATMNNKTNETYPTASPRAVYTSSDSGGIDSTNAALGDSNSADSGGVVAGVVVLVLALSIVAAVTVVLIILFKKTSKKNRCNLQPHNRLEHTRENGINNCTYDAGFINHACVDAVGSMYDEIRNPGPQAEKTGDENDNYFEVAESTFTGTYDCGGTEIYSDLTEQCTHTFMEKSEEQNRTERNIYETEEFYSSPDEPQTSLYYLLERNKQEDIYGDLNAYYAPASEENEIYSQLQTCGVTNISYTQIKITGHLGSGQFGNVEKGTWQGKEVALKTLKESSDEEDKVKFLQEAAIMAQFRHPNIVTLHGVVSDREPLMLVVELIHRGDLREYLHTMRPDPGELPVAGLPDMLLSFSQHVALGMHYLSSKGFVHRDLAARNILVSKDNICKVADFGMSRDLADETYYVSHGGMIPVKWTASEAIHYKKYSTASDVWSYGCLLYEIWSLGRKPFEELKNIEVIKLVDSNKRLSPPPGSPKLIYELMIKCWHPRTSSRPGFRELTIGLTSNPADVLSIPQDDLCTHKLAGVLGAPIEAAKDMYLDLKNIYTFESETNFYD